MIGVKYFGVSDAGRIRSNNEDAFLVNPELGFAALADGMGGAAAGELASKFFIDAAQEVFSRAIPENFNNAESLLRASFELANDKILRHIDQNPADRGMGCTAELLTFFGENFAIAHVGDSRTYLFRDGEIKLLTQDHSFVQELIKKGELNADEVHQHPMRHVILRAVGQEEKLEVEIIKGHIVHGDLFLLCSDGLTDMVGDHIIRDILSLRSGLDHRAQKLIDTANDTRGQDNVTVVLCEV
jgi:protein phosphatase